MTQILKDVKKFYQVNVPNLNLVQFHVGVVWKEFIDLYPILKGILGINTGNALTDFVFNFQRGHERSRSDCLPIVPKIEFELKWTRST